MPSAEIDDAVTAFDASVIIAGHDGLAAAVHLAATGRMVGGFERAPRAGRALETEQATLPGFRHDLWATHLRLFVGSPFFGRHEAGLVDHG